MKNIGIKKLNSRHKRMIEALAVHGATGKEVCDKFNISASRLSVLRQTKLWQDEEKNISEEVRQNNISKILKLAPKAIQTLEDTVGPQLRVDEKTVVLNDPKVRIQAAKEILNRCGLKDLEETPNNTVILQTYVPGWGTNSGKGEVVNIEFNSTNNTKI